jgi:UDP-glucose 4-epimerase
VASAAKVRRTLGWSPAFPTLRSVIETAWNWEQNRRF